MVNAGRILILAKGAWNSTTNYTQLDLVSYNSIAYLARQASVGVNPSTDTQMVYWMPFGSAASIATTSTPGLVMPDGQTITITNTGLIKAVLGLNDVSDVTITSPANGQVLKYNSSTQKWENGSLGTAAAKNATDTITSGSTDLIESGAVHSAIQTLTTQVNNALTNIQGDLTSISETGTTASQAISSGTYFYLNGELVRAKVAIAQGATFTLNTNYEVVTAGALNSIMGCVFGKVTTMDRVATASGYGDHDNFTYTVPSDGFYTMRVIANLINTYSIKAIVNGYPQNWLVFARNFSNSGQMGGDYTLYLRKGDVISFVGEHETDKTNSYYYYIYKTDVVC